MIEGQGLPASSKATGVIFSCVAKDHEKMISVRLLSEHSGATFSRGISTLEGFILGYLGHSTSFPAIELRRVRSSFTAIFLVRRQEKAR